jgi:CRISPR-associated protein Cas2
MRHRFLVAYDVSDAKRLRRIFKLMRGFGDPVQYSVFLCDLSATEQMLMKTALDEVIHHREDRVLVVDLGPADGTALDRLAILGRQDLPERLTAVVV